MTEFVNENEEVELVDYESGDENEESKQTPQPSNEQKK